MKKAESTENGLQPQAAKGGNIPERDFPIVALGASAGGLEAFTQFLTKLPKDSGMAFVLVQHLDPSHPSSLVELLARQSAIPIKEAEDGEEVQPDRAYVIPPGKAMSIVKRTLILEESQEHPGLAHAINLFLASLAEDLKERAVAIILSGTGSDGSEGARAIKEREGLVIVQDPASAKYDGMPRAAIEAGVADYILPPEAMPGKLREYLHQSFYERDQIRQSLKKENSDVKNIFSLVKARTGRDFSGYKISSVTRRIEHRMAVNGVGTIADYLKMLRENPAEIANLTKDFLIQVTSFFRDKEAFDSLKPEIAKMMRAKPESHSLRAWVPGCSSGEEAYSIAMILLECIQESGQNYEVQVFGTDLDTAAINRGRAGIYPDSIAQNVSQERLERFFEKVGPSYQVRKNVRESVIFAVHDLVTDPPYSHLDIVSIRNLLIYFDAELQNKIIPMLHYSLNEDGLLFLGTSETIGDFNELFATIDPKWRIYRSLKEKQRSAGFVFNQPGIKAAGALKANQTGALPGPTVEPILLLEALPPAVLVDRNHRIIYTHGDTSKFLRISEGKPSVNLLDMAKPEFRGILATLLHAASRAEKGVVSENVKAKQSGSQPALKISARTLNTLEGYLIITFEDLPGPKRRRKSGEPLTDIRYQELEQELERTRDTLRGTIEELKTANEELRSANEEYMSANEELKSANEELETSREELQSVNEELTTLNTESLRKNEDLVTLNNDMLNLINTVGIATVFLDQKLRIRRFTPAAGKLFKFIESDIGRPVADISCPLKINNLVKAATQVLDNLIPVEQEVQTIDDKWYSLRILPYRTLDNNIAGVVVSLVDISGIKAALQYAQDIIDNIREPLLVLDNKLRVISASRAFYQTFEVKPKETEGQFIFELGERQWDIPALRKILKDILDKDSVFEGYRVEHNFPVIGQRAMLLNARRIYDVAATQSILLAMEDITGRTGTETFSQKRSSGKNPS